MTERLVLPLTLTLLSDWHIGSGSGSHGRVDMSVQRDEDGLPFVPATTLSGIWRDACESVVFALDGGRRGPWHAWLEFLFGSQPTQESRGDVTTERTGPPRPAALLVDSLRFPVPLRRLLRDKPQLVEAAVFLKPGVKVDAVSGRAEDRSFRFEEMARGGTVLIGQAELSDRTLLDGEQKACAGALLDAAARLVESVGRRRRRGAGRCRLDVGALPADWRWLEEHRTPPPVPPAAGPTPTPAALPAPRPGRDDAPWEIADLRLILRRPLIAPERKVGNEVRSRTYVPGFVMLPAVLRSLSSPDAAVAARAGDLVITNAVVEVDGRQGEPAPLALVRRKGGAEEEQFNLLAESPAEGVHTEDFDGLYTGPYRPGEPVSVASCRIVENTHNTIGDLEQRPVRAVGGLFTYQAIAAGTVLRAQVRVRAGTLRPGWQKRLTGRWRLGTARKDGYGLTDVTATVPQAPAPRPLPEAGRTLRVRLLSDALVNDERLRPSTQPRHLAAELGRALGVVLRPADEQGGEHPVRFSERHRSDPWHSKWGLPRNSLLGMWAGSCLSFDVVDGVVTADAVRRVEQSGIGLRRAEGYGQVRIADPLLHAAFRGRGGGTSGGDGATDGGFGPSVGTDTAGGAGDLDEFDGPLLVLEEAAWRTGIQRAAETLAATAPGRARGIGPGHEKVPPAQLGTLRMFAAQVNAPSDPRIVSWLDGLDRVRGASTERHGPWPQETVADLRRLFTDGDEVWTRLPFPEEQQAPLAHPDRAARLRERLWGHAVRTLVDDCLTAHRRAAETEEGAR
ncbi:RAMP superfamily CRISPR-associated protein [Streptomyces griseomycini]|uniref:CRISPR-associated protein Csx10 n=1 Tax=Streptomyces griseomycini TaxID=66895 RepID=A0A7W7PY87_9ACTN|nr:RAMP superfamily CRISPR-associated protein [Streptomyces griseomycini]MBB4903475.1 CRISPR-associated protein Csx10 [Streptomyces griseomycini]GGR56586.1 hypothetical protein GCM10015536_71940 [Streptomyces griseomycini]